MSEIYHALRERLRVLRRALDRRWIHVAGVLWLVVGTYDTIGSQFLPKDKLPSIYEVVNMTSGFLPLWAWALIGMAIVTAGAIEYAAKKEGAGPWWGPRNQSPFAVSLPHSYADVRGNEFFFHTPITVRNSSSVLSFDAVEVHLVRIAQMKPRPGGTNLVNRRLIERASESPSFILTPSMQRDIFFLRMARDEKGPGFKLGPLERPNGQELYYGPGLYKIDITVYGRDAQPAVESLAVGLDESGGMTYGAWRDDLPWPFMTAEVTLTATPSPQSPASTQ